MVVKRPVLIAAFALGGAILIALIAVIVVFVLPRGGVTPQAAPAPTAMSSASTQPTASSKPTPTPTPSAVVAAPAPAEPEPQAPEAAPEVQQPAAPAPAPAPAPVAPKITSMAVTFSGACYDDQSTGFVAQWASTGATGSALLNLRSGGGTPIINTDYTVDPNGSQAFYLPCNRLYFYTLTVYNTAGSTWGRLTSKDGQDKGWSSN